MKKYTVLAAFLAFPMALATAQTIPTMPSTSSQASYIPLFGTSSGTGGTSNSTWFIDVANKLVVACTAQSESSTPTITCTAQPIPTAATGGGIPATGSTGSTGSTSGSGDTSASVLRSPFSK